MKRRNLIAGVGAGVATVTIPAAKAQTAEFEWKMITSWPKNFPGPGTGAQRLADRITAMSNGRIRIKLYGAGELVPALEVFDNVSNGVAELGHTASFFWRGKIPASVFFTTVPFGLTAIEHAAWIYHGGGQALWDEAYAPHGLRAFMAGNSGMQMGGWFKKEINGLHDLKGLKYRMPGLGAEVVKQLGVLPVLLPPSGILPALQSGAVDGAEFLGPWSDQAAGFYKVAPYYYWPGFHEPNGTAECLINVGAFEQLPDDLKSILENACAAENTVALSETEWENSKALVELVEKRGVQLRRFPGDVLTAARDATDIVMTRFAQSDPLVNRVYESFIVAKARSTQWARVATAAFLNARQA